MWEEINSKAKASCACSISEWGLVCVSGVFLVSSILDLYFPFLLFLVFFLPLSARRLDTRRTFSKSR